MAVRLCSMGPAFFVIAIMGCGEADAPCEQVGRVESRYESLVSCTNATEAAMMQHSDIAYPVVVAQCQPGNRAAAQLMAGDVKLPRPDIAARQIYAEKR